jgi:hypothetical protein
LFKNNFSGNYPFAPGKKTQIIPLGQVKSVRSLKRAFMQATGAHRQEAGDARAFAWAAVDGKAAAMQFHEAFHE